MTKRRFGKPILATLTGALVIGFAGGAALAGYESVPVEPAVAAAPAGEPADTTSSLVCDGGITRTIQGGIDVENVDENIAGWAGAFGSPRAAYGAIGEDATQTFEGALPAGALGTSDLGVPELRGTLEVTGGIAAGATSHTASAGDLRAVAINPCQWPANTVWLVGGSSEVGSSLQLTVTNPGLTQVSVDVSAYSSRGEADLGSLSMIHLAPGTTQTLLLDGLIPEDPRVALHLFSDTGPFTASLQTSSLDGARPAGVDAVTNSGIGRDLIVPGLVIDAASGAGDNADSMVPDPHVAAALRVANPGAEQATINISVLGEDGETPLPGGSDVRIAPGTVLDLSLDGLSVGSYGIRVEVDTDVSAAISVTREDDEGRDVAWLVAQEPIVDAGAAAFGPLPARLVLMGTAEATWQAFDESGAELSEEDVNVDGVATIELPGDSAYVVVTSDAEIYGSVWVSTDDGISAVPLTQDSSTSQAVTLTVRN